MIDAIATVAPWVLLKPKVWLLLFFNLGLLVAAILIKYYFENERDQNAKE